MKISIVGCGGMAHGVHMPCIKKYGGLDVVSCADIKIENAKSLGEKYGIPLYFSDYGEMLEKTNPDAIVCLVSENAVAEVSSDILRNYPVLLEKPPGKTAKETKAIFEAAQKSGKAHMVAFNRRFAPAYLKLRELLAQNGDADEIKYVNYKFHRIRRHEENFEDTAIHAIDAVKFLAGGDFENVAIKYREMPHLGKKVANYHIFFEFANGVFATAEILVSTGELSEGCEIHAGGGVYRASIPMGTGQMEKNSGGVEYQNADGKYRFFGKDEVCPQTEPYISQGFYNEHKHFYDCLKSKKDPGNGADTAVSSVAVCEALKNRESSLKF
ncbi:MAG: Gfo/Idh/MocA family oxidoreductase [Oscillospiraceae bacterium]|nr:Gfo/Idh/MocA family oxidoreductase [Oscillospiraceae bacterium]